MADSPTHKQLVESLENANQSKGERGGNCRDFIKNYESDQQMEALQFISQNIPNWIKDNTTLFLPITDQKVKDMETAVQNIRNKNTDIAQEIVENYLGPKTENIQKISFILGKIDGTDVDNPKYDELLKKAIELSNGLEISTLKSKLKGHKGIDWFNNKIINNQSNPEYKDIISGKAGSLDQMANFWRLILRQTARVHREVRQNLSSTTEKCSLEKSLEDSQVCYALALQKLKEISYKQALQEAEKYTNDILYSPDGLDLLFDQIEILSIIRHTLKAKGLAIKDSHPLESKQLMECKDACDHMRTYLGKIVERALVKDITLDEDQDLATKVQAFLAEQQKEDQDLAAKAQAFLADQQEKWNIASHALDKNISIEEARRSLAKEQDSSARLPRKHRVSSSNSDKIEESDEIFLRLSADWP